MVDADDTRCMIDLGGTIQEHDSICTKYGFDILIISGSYSGHR